MAWASPKNNSALDEVHLENKQRFVPQKTGVTSKKCSWHTERKRNSALCPKKPGTWQTAHAPF